MTLNNYYAIRVAEKEQNVIETKVEILNSDTHIHMLVLTVPFFEIVCGLYL